MRRHAFAAVLLAASATAQSPTHTVSGIAFDSIAGVALSGAVVQAVRVDTISGRAAQSFSAVANASGHFRLTGLPDGRFAVGFQHQSLSAFGLESPISGLELSADSTVTFNLALTSESVLQAKPCNGQAVLGGFVIDPRRERPMVGAEIIATWTELGLDRGKLTSAPRRISATAGEDGSYRLCGVPASATVELRVARAGYRRIESEFMIPDFGVGRRDFSLADSGAVRGTATLTGKILQDDGKGINSGVVSITALKLDVPVQNGTFTISELPAGTWALAIRAIGFEERNEMVDVVERASNSITLRMEKKVQTLETLNVIGKASRDIRTLSDIDERHRTGGSTVILPGNEYLAHAMVTADALRGARGFIQKDEWRFDARPYVDNGVLKACRMLPADTAPGGRGKSIAVYMDGNRYPMGLQMLNNDVLPSQVLAIEAYADVLAAPVQWRTNDACAVVAIWTKH